jgi:MoxR-like ATPase
MTMTEGAAAPFYLQQADECSIFAAAHANGLPVLLKGPTGCGKTRFVDNAATLVLKGMPVERAVHVAMIEPLSDEDDVKSGLLGLVTAVFG